MPEHRQIPSERSNNLRWESCIDQLDLIDSQLSSDQETMVQRNNDTKDSSYHDEAPCSVPKDFIAPQSPTATGTYRPDQEAANEHTPLTEDSPPPDYETSTAQYTPQTSSEPDVEVGAAAGREVGHSSSYFPPTGVKSMSDKVPTPSQDHQRRRSSSSSTASPRARWMNQSRQHIRTKHFLGAILVVFILTWLAVGVTNASKHRRHWNDGSRGEGIAIPPFPDTMNPDSGYPDERHTIIKETSQSVHGTYPLYDLLSVETVSGSISITVDLQPADESSAGSSEPAKLKLISRSGSIRVDFNIDPFAGAGSGHSSSNRSVVITAETQSGSISGTYPLSSSTTIKTGSGSISTEHVASYPDTLSTLHTLSHSGSTNVRVTAPLSASDTPLRKIKAAHLVDGSGSLNIEYPAAWEGKLLAQRRDPGHMSISGHGLRVWRASHHLLRGQKGEGDEEIFLRAGGSGSLSFRVEDV